MVVNGTSLLLREPIKDMLTFKHNQHGVSYGLSEAGYDIRIKQDIFFLAPVYSNSGNALKGPSYIIDDGPHLMGNFCIASAIEEFDMPSDLIGIVHDKSTWARKGLSVFNTVIEPGWKGFLTLELVYHGQEAFHIPAGSGIAQVVFHQTTDHKQYDGKYQNQEDRPVEAMFKQEEDF